jgi:hypothetical protein
MKPDLLIALRYRRIVREILTAINDLGRLGPKMTTPFNS